MFNADKRRLVITLHDIPGVGWKSIKKAVDAKLWNRKTLGTSEPWLSAGFRPEQANEAAKRFSGAGSGYDSIISEYDKRNAAVLMIDDEEYPQTLRNIHEPPWVLYAIGRIGLLHRHAAAIVGTRTPTAYGRHMAKELAGSFGLHGITVVSGLARGIDGIAHEASVDHEGSTVAVLATPIDRVYPPQHASLYRRIAAQGLLLSEAPLGMALHPGLFPLRNRIIAGLAAGTVVIEAADKSGSLITAEQAFAFNRELFAVPGPVTSPRSSGTNRLLVERKAAAITSVGDWFDQLPYTRPADDINSRTASAEPAEPLSGDARIVYDLLLDRPCTADELHELTGLALGHLHAVLINLCITRKVQLQHGSTYSVI